MKNKNDLHFVRVTVNLQVEGKTIGGFQKMYGRGRETGVMSMNELAQILFLYEKMHQFGATYTPEILKEFEKYLPYKDGETADSLFEKFWINTKKTIQEDFDRKNKGEGNFYPVENDYLKYELASIVNYFVKWPTQLKYGFLYYLYKYVFNSSLDEIKEDLGNVPEFIKNIIDNELIKKDGKN
jgi:hypothetical protein